MGVVCCCVDDVLCGVGKKETGDGGTLESFSYTG